MEEGKEQDGASDGDAMMDSDDMDDDEEVDQEQLNKVRVRVGGQDESDESSEDDVGIRVPDNQ